jgi:CheY-like chemotaxis protein
MPSPVFEIFEVELQNTLNNLYEPTYLPEACIFDILSISPEEGMESVRRNLVETIKAMGQEEIIPKTTKIHFLFLVLQQRFVISQSQEKAAEILQISPRHFRRKQNEAVHALALAIWNKHKAEALLAAQEQESVDDGVNKSENDDKSTNLSWAETVLKEIAVLNQRSSGITTDVNKVVQRTVEMSRLMLSSGKIRLVVEDIAPELVIALHPNVLRQVLLFITQHIDQSEYEGPVTVSARVSGDMTIVSFALCEGVDPYRFQVYQIQELATILGGKVEMIQNESTCLLELGFPNSDNVTVLVIDDNLEIERLYRQLTVKTRYEIYYLPSGADLAAQISKVNPDILVIDVLLPGQDGWDLLMQLRQEPSTANLPVIVSSVMGSSEIAHSLGATAYLPKPFERKQLLQALDRAVSH